MKNRFRLLILMLAVAGTVAAQQQEPISAVINRGLERSLQQSLILAKSLENEKGLLPRTYDKKGLHKCNYKNWVSGFFPGVLWYLMESLEFRDESLELSAAQLEYYARLYTERIDSAKYMTWTHDLGFIINDSYGLGYRLTGDPKYLAVMEKGAESLATRFNKKVGLIQSWGQRNGWQYPVIIDNMLNLEYLMDVAQLTGKSEYADMAISHATKTMKNHFREDYSCYHVVSYNPETGEPEVKCTYQGYADHSAWARGQAWALYGFTMMYRETGKKEFLEHARKVANYICSHPRMPEDKVPFWDFDDPKIPNTYRDASAAACMASGFIELSQYDPNKKDAKRWLDMAEQQIRSLSSPAYMAEVGEQGGFILKHSVGNLNKKSEVDVPLTYGDYYYVEALVRLKKLYQGQSDRKQWVGWMTRIYDPVVHNLANGTLKEKMPYESINNGDRRPVSYLEAFGRSFCGVAPWLELGADETEEGKLRKEYIDLTIKALANAVNPKSPDYMDFTKNVVTQPLVDAAYLCEGLLHSRTQIYDRLDKQTRKNLFAALEITRTIKPNESNWLLFASTVEAFMLEATGKCDTTRLWRGIRKFMYEGGWYQGDALYGDGPKVNIDYYNSLVINPMLTEVLTVMVKHKYIDEKFLMQQQKREGRLAQLLERVISPEGTYPALGRSVTYRFGHFHGLSHAVLLGLLPKQVPAGQARSALTAVIRRQISSPGTFDKDGWLTVGFAGHQPRMSEKYINTGSEYMCMAAFMALGLPADASFWSEPWQEWSNIKAWRGQDIGADHALRDKIDLFKK